MLLAFNKNNFNLITLTLMFSLLNFFFRKKNTTTIKKNQSEVDIYLKEKVFLLIEKYSCSDETELICALAEKEMRGDDLSEEEEIVLNLQL